MVKIDTTISFGTTHTFIAHIYPASPRVQDVRKNWCDVPNTFPGPSSCRSPRDVSRSGRAEDERTWERGWWCAHICSFFSFPLSTAPVRTVTIIKQHSMRAIDFARNKFQTANYWYVMRKFAHAHLLSVVLAKGLVYTFHANLVPRDFLTFQTRANFEKRPGEGPGNELAVHANTRLPFLCLHSEQHFNWKKAFTMNNRRTVCTVDENASRSMHFQTKTH